MPPKYPNIARYESGRENRLTIPSKVRPTWFKDGLEVIFVPLYWKDDLDVSITRKLEAMLICGVNRARNVTEWHTNPLDYLEDLDSEHVKPEEQFEGMFIFKSTLTYNNRQFKVVCPPFIKGMCDEQGRLIVLEHSLGVSLWSPPAFNEQYAK